MLSDFCPLIELCNESDWPRDGRLHWRIRLQVRGNCLADCYDAVHRFRSTNADHPGIGHCKAWHEAHASGSSYYHFSVQVPAGLLPPVMAAFGYES